MPQREGTQKGDGTGGRQALNPKTVVILVLLDWPTGPWNARHGRVGR